MEEMASLYLMQRYYDISEEDNMLLTKRYSESRDDTGQYIKQL